MVNTMLVAITLQVGSDSHKHRLLSRYFEAMAEATREYPWMEESRKKDQEEYWLKEAAALAMKIQGE